MKASLSAWALCLILISFCPYVQGGSPVPPAEVLRATFEAANAGRFAEAEKHLTVAAAKQINSLMARLAGGHIKLWDGWTHNRTMTRFEVLKEETDKGEVTVYYRLHFKDGTTKDDDDSLILEGGEWKLLP